MGVTLRHIFIAFACFCTLTISAQSLTEHYKSLYGSAKNCKTYHGLLDEIFPLEMLICGDKGVYKMTSSSDIYSLSIESDGDTMEMVEEDSQERTSGLITLIKSTKGNTVESVYTGEWKNIESAVKYPFTIFEFGQKIPESPNYITKLSGSIRSRAVDITIDHAHETIEIVEKYGLKKRYKSNYTCQNKWCSKLLTKPNGFIGVNSIEIHKNIKGEYKLIVLTADRNRETSDLELLLEVKSKIKAYSDYRSMLLAEYAVFDDNNNLNEFIHKQQAEWIKTTSIKLKEILESDPTEIVSERLKHQASSWIELELWTEDFISGIQYKQYNWQDEVDATAFAYYIDKSKEVSLSDVWEDEWNLDKIESSIDHENSTWVVGREALYKVYFDRINGVQRETFPYVSLVQHIDRGSWLDKLLDQDKIKD